jgi:hypothetical protein
MEVLLCYFFDDMSQLRKVLRLSRAVETLLELLATPASVRVSGGCRHALLGKWMAARHTDCSSYYLYMQWDL